MFLFEGFAIIGHIITFNASRIVISFYLVFFTTLLLCFEILRGKPSMIVAASLLQEEESNNDNMVILEQRRRQPPTHPPLKTKSFENPPLNTNPQALAYPEDPNLNI